MKQQFILTLLLSLLLVGKAFAQDGWDWGGEPQKAKEKYTLFSDNLKMKNFDAIVEPLQWLLENTPNLNKTLYMKAFDAYKGLAEKSEDAAKKQEYQNKALDMYERRIEHFGEKAEVYNRKGYYALVYQAQQSEKYPDLYDFYGEIIELNGDNTYRLNIQNYMYLVSIMKNNNLKEVDEDKVIEIYEKLEKIVNKNIEKGEDKAGWEETHEYIENLYKGLVTVDCDFVKNRMVPELKEVPEENKEERIEKMSKIIAALVKAGCTKDPIFLEMSESLTELEPTPKRIGFLVKAYLARNNLTKALEYLNKASVIAETAEDKAEIFMTTAKIKAQQGDKVSARSYAQKAVQASASKAYEAYSLIGDLYLGSGGQCKGSDATNPCHAKAVYIAAYNMYQRAGNSAKAAKAQQYFPTRTEIFTHSMGGKSVNVGCWIGETVVIPNL